MTLRVGATRRLLQSVAVCLVAVSVLDGVAVDAATSSSSSSVCKATSTHLTCPYKTTALSPVGRQISYSLPAGTPPADGWPTVLMFHGFNLQVPDWLHGDAFNATTTETGLQVKGQQVDYGQFYNVQLTQKLLDSGFAVVAPNAGSNTQPFPGVFWESNLPPFANDLSTWSSSGDFAELQWLFMAMSNGTLGPLNMRLLHATGFSSGAVMTSRLAFSYPGMFRSLSLNSGCLYYCGWTSTCANPSSAQQQALLQSHPPTLFIHGLADGEISPNFSQQYYTLLRQNGVATSRQPVAGMGHQWASIAPTDVYNWIVGHNTPASGWYASSLQAFLHHGSSIVARNKTEILLDYAPNAVVQVFNATSGHGQSYVGHQQISGLWDMLLKDLGNCNAAAPPAYIAVEYDSVVIDWSCAVAGIENGQDVIHYDAKLGFLMTHQSVFFRMASPPAPRAPTPVSTQPYIIALAVVSILCVVLIISLAFAINSARAAKRRQTHSDFAELNG